MFWWECFVNQIHKNINKIELVVKGKAPQFQDGYTDF